MNDGTAVTRSIGRFDARRWTVVVGLVAVLSLLLLAAAWSVPPRASAAEAPVGLGTAASYSALAGTTVTNTGPTTLDGDLGVSPGTAITGFPPGVVAGAVHAGDTAAAGAEADLTLAYNDAAGRVSTANVAGDLGGLTLLPGVYTASSSIGLTGNLTLDAQGDTNAVFIFQVGSTLTTASGSTISMINGAQPCNVFWQIGSSATLGTGSGFVGSILALTSITVTTGVTFEGRALARNGAVTLDSDVFLEPGCQTVQTTTTVPLTTTPAAQITTSAPRAGGAPPPPDALANTGTNRRLPILLCAGAALLILGGLLTIVTRDRRVPRKPPHTK
jgi:ice-binding like protein